MVVLELALSGAETVGSAGSGAGGGGGSSDAVLATTSTCSAPRETGLETAAQQHLVTDKASRFERVFVNYT